MFYLNFSIRTESWVLAKITGCMNVLDGNRADINTNIINIAIDKKYSLFNRSNGNVYLFSI